MYRYVCIYIYRTHGLRFSLIFLCGFYFHSCRSDGSPVQIHKWRPITSTFTNIWTCIKFFFFTQRSVYRFFFKFVLLLAVVYRSCGVL